jgi:hypothetical protein
MQDFKGLPREYKKAHTFPHTFSRLPGPVVHRGVAFSLGRLWLACCLAFDAWVDLWQWAMVVLMVVLVVTVLLLLLLLLLHCGVLANGEHCRHPAVAHS